ALREIHDGRRVRRPRGAGALGGRARGVDGRSRARLAARRAAPELRGGGPDEAVAPRPGARGARRHVERGRAPEDREPVRLMPPVLVLSHDDVVRTLSMGDCIEAMGDALAANARGEMYQPLRSIAVPPGGGGFIGLMPAQGRGAYSLKSLVVIP